MRPERRPRAPLLISALLGALGTLACATLEHHLQAERFVARPLATRSAEGAERLESEIRVDPTIAAYVAEHGRPDYLYLESREKVYFVYLAGDGAALFRRPFLARSDLTELGRIPGSILERLPRAERQALLARRSREARLAQAKARRARQRIERSAPAARAPGGATFRVFPAAEIVERMRPPLTAADPGVSGWRAAELREGGRVYTAKAGATRYEVRDDRVAFTVPLPSGGRVSVAARLGVQRVNNAVFGARAGAVTEQVMRLVERAAAGCSASAGFARRVAGRTVRVACSPSRGVLAYSVHP